MNNVAANGQQLVQPGMMTVADAKKHIEPENFTLYRDLGGRMKQNAYRYCAATFIRMTIDIFVGGDPKFFASREEALGYFQIWMNENGYQDKATRIWKSIDGINSYT